MEQILSYGLIAALAGLGVLYWLYQRSRGRVKSLTYKLEESETKHEVKEALEDVSNAKKDFSSKYDTYTKLRDKFRKRNKP